MRYEVMRYKEEFMTLPISRNSSPTRIKPNKGTIQQPHHYENIKR